MKKNKNTLLIILCLILVFSIYKISIFLIEIGHNNQVNKKLIKDVVKVKKIAIDKKEVEKFIIDYDSLLKKNKDVRAWIRFNHDKVNYPIVQSTDNSYYLNHDINNKKNTLGAIFMDYRNRSLEDKNVVLFGHNVTDESMFGSLKETLKKKFFDDEENKIIEIIDSNNNVYHYEIFSVYTIVKEEYYITINFDSDKEYTKFLNTIKSRSIKKFNSDLSKKDRILTLSTCDGVGATNKRLVVHARLKKD